MSIRTLCVESENLRGIAVLNGRAKAQVSVHWLESNVLIHSDELNPVASKQRDAFVERIAKESPAFRQETAVLLVDLAEQVIAQRANAKPEKKEMQGQELSLPVIEPWESEVEGASVLGEMAAIIRRFIVLPDAERDAVALHAMHAHTIDAAQVSPILIVTAAEKRCGKSNTGTVYQALTPRSMQAANLTAATLFRMMETFKPTLICDETDTYLGEKEELRGIINSGHVRSRATLPRTVGDDHTLRLFSTWGAKVLIGIRASTLHDTTIDRGIVVELKRKTASERVEGLRFDQIDGICHDIRRRAARWANDHLDALRDRDPSVPETLNDRAADNWRPLLAIADEAGADWSARARAAAVLLSGGEPDSSDDSIGAMLLADFRALFAERACDRIPSAEALAWLHQREAAPWGDWSRGQPITARRLAGLLKPFHIRPKVHRIGKTTPRSYEREDFDDAFARYLHPQSATSATPLRHNDLHDSQSATYAETVADEQTRNSLQGSSVADVADGEGILRESYEESERLALGDPS